MVIDGSFSSKVISFVYHFHMTDSLHFFVTFPCQKNISLRPKK